MKRVSKKRMATLALGLFAMLAGSYCLTLSPAFSQGQTKKAPPELAPFLPPQVQELAYLQVGPPMAAGDTWVAAYSFREVKHDSRELGLHSRILMVGPERPGGQAKMLWQSKDEELYAPRLTLERRLTYKGGAIIIVGRHSGAGWQNLDIIGFADQRPRLLSKIEGVMGYELKALSSGQKPVLVVGKQVYVTPLPDIFEWDGERFVNATSKYPQYFDGVLKKGFRFHDEKMQPLELAIMTARAGQPGKARKMLEELLDSEKQRGTQADKYRISAIEQELK